MEEEKKQGGFWKGFFCATILFGFVAVISLIVTMNVGDLETPQSTEVKSNQMKQNNLITQSNLITQNNLTTQNKEVQQKLGLIESYIRDLFLDEIDEKQLEDYLYYGLVAGLGDPYAAYYNEEETLSMIDSSSGSYCGIGAVFSQNMMTGVVTVSKVYEGCPSYEAGMLPGDILYKVNGEDVTGQDLTPVVTKIKGEEGTEVTVTMIRGEEEIDFVMERRTIEVPTIEHEMLPNEIGYIQISEFDGVTSEQFHNALIYMLHTDLRT